MKKVIGVIVAIVIVWIMGALSAVVKVMVEATQQDGDLSKLEFVLLGLTPLIPFIIAIWLIKFSWRKITYVKED